jgi:exopolysaccharide production protein ExoY
MRNSISAFLCLSQQREQALGNREWQPQLSAAGTAAAKPPLPNHRRNRTIGVVRFCHARSVVGGIPKRWFDISAAITVIIFLLPLFCLIALAIKLSGPGPVLYRHRRIGTNGTAFDCLKFRTMVVNADEVLQRHLTANRDAACEWERERKLKTDPRVTPLGLSLRKTSLDELPQLINILKGEMSFVGPRPIVAAEVPKYADCIAHYFRARPGLTGLWQVSGRNDVDYATRVSLDCHYVENWSFWRDLAIIVITFRVVATSRGCY